MKVIYDTDLCFDLPEGYSHAFGETEDGRKKLGITPGAADEGYEYAFFVITIEDASEGEDSMAVLCERINAKRHVPLRCAVDAAFYTLVTAMEYFGKKLTVASCGIFLRKNLDEVYAFTIIARCGEEKDLSETISFITAHMKAIAGYATIHGTRIDTRNIDEDVFVENCMDMVLPTEQEETMPVPQIQTVLPANAEAGTDMAAICGPEADVKEEMEDDGTVSVPTEPAVPALPAIYETDVQPPSGQSWQGGDERSDTQQPAAAPVAPPYPSYMLPPQPSTDMPFYSPQPPAYPHTAQHYPMYAAQAQAFANIPAAPSYPSSAMQTGVPCMPQAGYAWNAYPTSEPLVQSGMPGRHRDEEYARLIRERKKLKRVIAECRWALFGKKARRRKAAKQRLQDVEERIMELRRRGRR